VLLKSAAMDTTTRDARTATLSRHLEKPLLVAAVLSIPTTILQFTQVSEPLHFRAVRSSASNSASMRSKTHLHRQFHRAHIVGKYFQLHFLQRHSLGVSKASLQEAAPDTLAPPFGSNAHAKTADMRKPNRGKGQNIAKSDDFSCRECRRLRQAACDDVLQKCTGVFQRPAIDRRQIPLFLRDRLHGIADQLRVRFACRTDFDVACDTTTPQPPLITLFTKADFPSVYASRSAPRLAANRAFSAA